MKMFRQHTEYLFTSTQSLKYIYSPDLKKSADKFENRNYYRVFT